MLGKELGVSRPLQAAPRANLEIPVTVIVSIAFGSCEYHPAKLFRWRMGKAYSSTYPPLCAGHTSRKGLVSVPHAHDALSANRGLDVSFHVKDGGRCHKDSDKHVGEGGGGWVCVRGKIRITKCRVQTRDILRCTRYKWCNIEFRANTGPHPQGRRTTEPSAQGSLIHTLWLRSTRPVAQLRSASILVVLESIAIEMNSTSKTHASRSNLHQRETITEPPQS